MKSIIKNMASKLVHILFPEKLWIHQAKSQNSNKESSSLVYFSEKFGLHKSFVEFGFHTFEYNSVGLTKLNHKGLLLDSDIKNCKLANKIFKRLHLNTVAKTHWITQASIHPILEFVKNNNHTLGVLNIDIDGNDYWILQTLLSHFKPEMICVEHNASFGLRKISTPYNDTFDRHRYHPSGWYHGASITAFDRLLENDYILIKNIVGLNLIYIRKDKISGDVQPLSAEKVYSECLPRNQLSSTDAKQQWETIKHMPFVEC